MRHDECMVNSFILVRHAETPYSAQGRMNPDSTVEVGLTAPGERAARGLGRDLAGERIDALCVAPSLRTRLTAAAIVADRDVSTHVVDQLAEIGVGAVRGRPRLRLHDLASQQPADRRTARRRERAGRDHPLPGRMAPRC